ncbi:MAG TPA: TetR/AcrR family transcriptional regulator C-terminal domain-containing protein [Chloroflexia bacterium]|nr:TetR/AcrR family transcriptional regulator C-terminal domain-containing protein [Chloroflexia bacterium]
MSTPEPRHIVSRRSRPAKPSLSRDVIVSTALDLLTRDGLAGLSLRKVAAALDTGPASLYVYVASLAELHALMLDRALAAVALPAARAGGWRDRLAAVLASYLRVLYNGPGLAQLALTTIPAGPNALRLIETLLDLLLEGGIAPPVAAWAVDLLTLHVAAVAAEQSAHRAQGDDALGPVTRAVAAVSAADYPHIHALRAELLSGGDTRFGWGVDVLLNGVLHAPDLPPATAGVARPSVNPTAQKESNP